ncbi:hypothetical protein [Azomonas macrocytogenes]|nr:hypothetical protein [Azomonas macrocytogenes]
MTINSSKIYFPLLILGLFLHFSVLGESIHNPYGIKMINELYLAICIGFAGFLIMAKSEDSSREFHLLLYYSAFSIFMFIILPAIFSNLMYGQPLIYGIIEERRVMFCLGAIPLLFMAKRVNVLEFERAIVYSAMIAVFFTWCFKFGLIADTREKVLSSERPDRSTIGPNLMALAYFYGIQIWSTGTSPIDGSKRSKNFYLLVAFVMLMTLAFGTQIRQLLAMCLLFTLFCLRLKAVVWAVALVVLALPFYFFPDLLKLLGLNVEFYTQAAQKGMDDNIRGHTIDQIFHHLDQVNWLPSGSLSLMWNDGFIPYFGEWFFLSDVGFFGTAFRFGFLAFLVVPISLYVYNYIAKNICSDMTFIYTSLFAYFITWPLNGLFEYDQPVFAIYFVILSLRAMHYRTLEGIYERRPYSQLQGSY